MNYPSRCTYEIYRGQSLITDLSKTYSIFSKTSQGHSSIDLTHIGLLFVLGKYALRSFKKATPSFSIAPTPYVTWWYIKKLFYYITKKVKRIIFPIKWDKLNILTYGITRWQNAQEFKTYDFGHVLNSITVFSDIL